MRDTRLQQSITLLDEALHDTDRKVRWMLRDALKLLNEITDETGGASQETRNINRAAAILLTAEAAVAEAIDCMDSARCAVKQTQTAEYLTEVTR